jgi:hypothetical protein
MELLEHVRAIKVLPGPSPLATPVPTGFTPQSYLSLEKASNGFVMNGNNGRVVISSIDDLAMAVKEYFS